MYIGKEYLCDKYAIVEQPFAAQPIDLHSVVQTTIE